MNKLIENPFIIFTLHSHVPINEKKNVIQTEDGQFNRMACLTFTFFALKPERLDCYGNIYY